MVNENAPAFWERVKALIKQNSTTQDWVSSQCDVSLNVFKSWIFNKRLPDAAQAARIARSLGTSVEYLVYGDDATGLAAENAALKEKLRLVAEAIK